MTVQLVFSRGIHLLMFDRLHLEDIESKRLQKIRPCSSLATMQRGISLRRHRSLGP